MIRERDNKIGSTPCTSIASSWRFHLTNSSQTHHGRQWDRATHPVCPQRRKQMDGDTSNDGPSTPSHSENLDPYVPCRSTSRCGLGYRGAVRRCFGGKQFPVSVRKRAEDICESSPFSNPLALVTGGRPAVEAVSVMSEGISMDSHDRSS